MEINEQKRQKFMENAGKRVNNVLHNIQILEPMARSNSYDFTQGDVEEMFTAIQETLDSTKQEFYKKFEMKSKSERKAFAFGQRTFAKNEIDNVCNNVVDNSNENEGNLEKNLTFNANCEVVAVDSEIQNSNCAENNGKDNIENGNQNID